MKPGLSSYDIISLLRDDISSAITCSAYGDDNNIFEKRCQKVKVKKVLISILTILFIISAVCMGGNPSESNAAADVLLTKNPTTTQYRGKDEEATEKSEEPDTSNVQDNRSFRLDATARRVTGGAGCYDVTITAYSAAVDFSGYIRMSIINSSDDSIAYDTRINLPEKTEKSFVLRIPNEGYFDINFKVIISILDENMNEVYTLNRNDLFVKADEEAVFVGVLSSDFDKLSYLAIDGWELDRLKDRYEVRLVELNENNIIDELDRLSYIVIDDYDTSKLDASTIKQIENYVQSGGILFLGTGRMRIKP